ncbi:uncharacterized protein LOC143040363 [Oratosquilla oratoria]|uniref:uncharacterized protein LOC143040363 n=1 Tax=Oratosquilla oratoria TaxID=337810 RepID=UPI003F76C0F2
MQSCCFCISLQKGVVAIGVLSIISSMLTTVGYAVVSATFEEHVVSCRQGQSNDLLNVLPACILLADASTLLAARIFLYVLAALSFLFLIFSFTLVIGAIKERGGLLVPWLVFAGVVAVTLIWAGVRAAMNHRTPDLLGSIGAFVILLYCVFVVRSYGRHLSTTRTITPAGRPRDRRARGKVGWGDLRRGRPYEEEPDDFEDELPDRPPAYTARSQGPTKKMPLPTGLGVKY